MAEETQKPAASEEVVAVVEEPKPVAAPEPEPEPAAKEEEPVVVEITQSASFKEETNLVGDLPDPQKKALDELKSLIQEALNKHEFTAPPPPPAKEEEPKTEEKVAEAEIKQEETSPEAETKKEEVKEETCPAPSETVAEAETKKEETSAETVAEAETKKEETSAETVAEAETKKEEVKEETSTEPTETVVVVEEVVAVVDEDGSKTVEAIEETIVSVEAAPAPAAEHVVAPEEVSIFGIPLLGDDRSDTILLKFLRARDFKAKDAFPMLKNTVKWRKEFGIEALLDEDLGTDLEKAVFMHGFDKEGHPVCYNVYGAFQDKDLYQNCFSDEEKRVKFLRWRIQFLEKSIRKLDFSPTGVCTIVQVNDFKNSPGPAKRELRQATNQALTLLQDNYPEFVAKQVFINVPWWYLAFNKMISPFLTQRTKSKFVFAGPSKSAETLFKYIAPEQVPVQYGGHSREGEQEFTVSDSVTEITIKPSSKHTVEFPVSETSAFVWELRVVGWDVSYGAEFVPSHEEGYTVIVSKTRKVSPSDEPIITDSYKIGEPGKIVLTLDNQTSKKKKLLYRTKAKPLVE